MLSNGRPFIRLITRNFGSVAGGSFLNAFFGLFDIFYNLFRVFCCLFSAIPRAPVERPLAVGNIAAVAATSCLNWLDLTPTRTFT